MKIIATKAQRHKGFTLKKLFVYLCVFVPWWLISQQRRSGYD